MRSTYIPALTERLNLLKNERDLSTRDIQKGSGVSHSAVSSIQGGGGASAATVVKLAAYFGVSADWLLGLSDRRERS